MPRGGTEITDPSLIASAVSMSSEVRGDYEAAASCRIFVFQQRRVLFSHCGFEFFLRCPPT